MEQTVVSPATSTARSIANGWRGIQAAVVSIINDGDAATAKARTIASRASGNVDTWRMPF